jgi:hypothetical protein
LKAPKPRSATSTFPCDTDPPSIPQATGDAPASGLGFRHLRRFSRGKHGLQATRRPRSGAASGPPHLDSPRRSTGSWS